jgi:peptide/nickel transport system permease protein
MNRKALGLYVLRRLALTVVLLVVVSFAAFSLLYITPGSPAQDLIGDRAVTPKVLAAITAKYHLNEPFFEQFGRWLGQVVLHLNFGTSIQTGQSVGSMLSESFGVTGFLALYASVIAIVGGIPLGVLAAVRRRRATDRVVVGTTVFVSSTPVFVSGVLLLYLFAVVLKVFPSYGAGSGFADRLWHLTLPAITLGAAIMALVVKLTRTAVSNTLEQDYVAFARARGVSRRRVLVRHAMRNALVPIVTAGGLVLTAVLGGSVLTEVTFSLPGLGEMLISGVNNKDYPVVQGVALVIAASVVLVNLIVDVLYTVIDPRIAFGRSGS